MNNKVEVLRNGKTVYTCSKATEGWDYIENQLDKETAKYTVIVNILGGNING